MRSCYAFIYIFIVFGSYFTPLIWIWNLSTAPLEAETYINELIICLLISPSSLPEQEAVSNR